MDDPNVVSPGILGFLAFFFLAVSLYLLLRNMNGHLRRMGYRAAELEKQEQLAREERDEPAEPDEPGEPPEPDERDEPKTE
jgi:hypothetical protein